MTLRNIRNYNEEDTILRKKSKVFKIIDEKTKKDAVISGLDQVSI